MQIQGRDVEREPSGIQLREVQNFIHQPQQAIGGPIDLPRERRLLAIERRIQQQPGKPENGIHWGPYFVAHRGNEVGFRPVGFFRGLSSAFQRVRGRTLPGNVTRDQNDAALAGLGLDRKQEAAVGELLFERRPRICMPRHAPGRPVGIVAIGGPDMPRLLGGQFCEGDANPQDPREIWKAILILLVPHQQSVLLIEQSEAFRHARDGVRQEHLASAGRALAPCQLRALDFAHLELSHAHDRGEQYDNRQCPDRNAQYSRSVLPCGKGKFLRDSHRDHEGIGTGHAICGYPVAGRFGRDVPPAFASRQ